MATKEMRPMRGCDICGVVDDHPRHVVTAGVGTFPPDNDLLDRLLAAANTPDEMRAVTRQVSDTSQQTRHMDCCREAGCPDGSCNAIADTGAADLRGAALVKHLKSGKIDGIGETISETTQIVRN